MKQTKASILYFMGPAMLLFCLIFIYPVSRTAIMSFFSVKSVTSAASTWSWAGLDNYIKLFHTPLFITSVINIGKIWLYCGIACLGLAIVLAIILTSGLRGQKFFRAIIYMDYFTRKHTSVIDIYVELENREYMGEFIEFMRDAGLTMSNLQMEPDYLGTNSINSVAFVVTVRSLEHRPHDSMIDTLRHIPHLKFIEEL